ncbi:transcription factor [Candidatus Scalindua japonica]|uniref:Transcription factor n=1 Tax=Candidatus Scalindua japonica TaxID=1284222 RepID=A0A286U1Y6_9BACT|nr:YlbF family regulator [Candidatus Scalindua japonica]GAX62071.1 transcription factor [Candidatus Scalindua japonica]
MEEILEIASKLGAAIVSHNRYKTFKDAEEQLKNDDEAKEISEELEKQSKKVSALDTD